MRSLTRLVAAGLLAALPFASAWGDMVVVVHPDSGVESLSRDDVINIFLGRFRQLPSGQSAHPVDLPAASAEKAQFYRLLVHKDLAEINSYWARLVFAGRTTPPRQAASLDEARELVARTPGAVGYMERSRADARVKVVFSLGAQP